MLPLLQTQKQGSDRCGQWPGETWGRKSTTRRLPTILSPLSSGVSSLPPPQPVWGPSRVKSYHGPLRTKPCRGQARGPQWPLRPRQNIPAGPPHTLLLCPGATEGDNTSPTASPVRPGQVGLLWAGEERRPEDQQRFPSEQAGQGRTRLGGRGQPDIPRARSQLCCCDPGQFISEPHL